MAKQQAVIYTCDTCCRRLEGRSSGVLLPKGAQVFHGVGVTTESLSKPNTDETALCVACLTKAIGKPPSPLRSAPEPPAPPPARYEPEPDYDREPRRPGQATGRPCITDVAPDGVRAPLAHGDGAWG